MAGRFSVEAVFKAVDQLTAPIARMQSRVETFKKATEKSFGQLNQAADKWIGGLTKATKAVAASTLAVGAALAVAAQPGMDFEQAMADLGASYLKARKEIGPLEKEALRLGKATKFSATDVVKAMEEMSKAGYSEKENLEAIRGMTFAAAASGEDLISTTTSVSAAMKSMGVPTGDAAKVADVLAMVSTKTASSIASLAESLSKAGPAARQLEVPFNDTVKMVALLQDVGIDAAEAGTSVGTMLTMLAKPTDKARALMRKLGVSFEDASGNMLPVPKVLEQFGKAAQGSKGNMKQLAFFAELLGLRGQRAAINLQKLFTDIDPDTKKTKWEALTEDIGEAAGTAEKMSDLRMKTLTGELDQIVETVKTLGVELFTVQSEKLQAFAREIKKWFEDEGPKYVKLFGEKVEWLSTNFDKIVNVLKRVGRVIWVITAAAIATKLWSAALAVLSATPAVMILYAIVAVISLIVAFWPEISAFFVNLGKYAVIAAQAVGAAFVWLWGAMIATGTAAFGTLWEIIKFPFLAAKDFLFNVVMGFFKDFWRVGVLQAAINVFGNLFDVFSTTIDRIKETWSPLTDFFRDLWGGMVGNILKSIGDVVSKTFTVIAAVFGAILQPIFDSIMWAVGKVQGLLGWQDDEANVTGSMPISSAPPQIVSPQERVAKSVSETTTTNVSELLIRDETGRANFTSKNPGPGLSLNMSRSGPL